MTHHSRTVREQRGSASIWALLVTATAFTFLLGLVVDGGRVIDARIQSARVAGQAARYGADALSESSVRNGHDEVSVPDAGIRAQSYLHQAGMNGTVRVSGSTVTVTVNGRSKNRILDMLGIASFPIQETRTARAVTEEGTP